MNIGIYKIGKEIIVNEKGDFAGWSNEPLSLARVFKRFGNDVTILSDISDKVSEFSYEDRDRFDGIVVVSGPMSLEKNPNIIQQLRQKTDRYALFATDMKLFAGHEFDVFDKIFWNATRNKDSRYSYSGDLELMYFDFKQKDTEKRFDFYFGGGERNRSQDFFEYVWRPGHVLNIKSTTLGIDNRVGRDEYMQQLSRAKYSIVIADGEYNAINFVNTRHAENNMNNVISFVDKKFDQAGDIIPIDDFRRVGSYIEMAAKIKLLNENPKLYGEVLRKQKAEIKPEYISGQYVYDLYAGFLGEK